MTSLTNKLGFYKTPPVSIDLTSVGRPRCSCQLIPISLFSILFHPEKYEMCDRSMQVFYQKLKMWKFKFCLTFVFQASRMITAAVRRRRPVFEEFEQCIKSFERATKLRKLCIGWQQFHLDGIFYRFYFFIDQVVAWFA